jgi:hypothetical protein
MHVLLEVLQTLQAASFQYFVDLEDLINNFFTQAELLPLMSFIFSIMVHVFYPGSGPLQGSSHGNPPTIIILKRREKGIQHAINKLGRFTSKVLTIS